VLYKPPLALACWKDTIAVGVQSGDILCLDAITGSQVAVLSGHADWVRSLTFLPDGTSLVSGSLDKTLKLWDLQTGGVVKTFRGHTDSVLSVSISSNCTTIASGSRDKAIRLWDVETGDCHHIIEQQEEVASVSFSPANPQRLISVSGSVIQQWDVSGCQVGPTYRGSHAAFSSDGTHFVLCRGKVAMVRNSDSGAVVAKCPPGSDNSEKGFNYCSFSPSGGLVAIAAGTAAYVWDITGSDPRLITTFVGHNDDIISITFSSPSTLISVSKDQSVKFWQIGTLLTDPAGTSMTSTPLNSPIESITLQAKDRIAISSDSAGVVRVWDLSTGLCKAPFQTPAKGSSWGDVRIIDGKSIFVWHVEGEGEIYIWDIEKGEPLQTVKAHSQVRGLRISGDGSKVFCLDEEFVRAWSIWTGEAMGEVKLEDASYLDPLCVDGSRIWVCFKSGSPQEWDFGISGSSPVLLSNTSSERPRLHFIGGTLSGDPTRIRDTVTEKEVFQLSGRYANPSATQWDGRYLVAGYDSGEVVILDCNHLCV
jgi:WD40 repeat protein